MASVRWFRVPLSHGSQSAAVYFYETDTGMFDLQYGLGKDTTPVHGSLRDAMSELRGRLQSDGVVYGVNVTLGVPLEVTWDEVKQETNRWYYRNYPRVVGPILLDELKRLFESGELKDSCEVQREGTPFWTPILSVPELKQPARSGWLARLQLWWQRVKRDSKMRERQRAESRTRDQARQQARAKEQRKRAVEAGCVHDWRSYSHEDRGDWWVCSKCQKLSVDRPRPD